MSRLPNLVHYFLGIFFILGCTFVCSQAMAESRTFYGLGGRCSSMCPKAKSRVHQICKRRKRLTRIRKCGCNENFDDSKSSATVQFSCIKPKPKKKPKPRRKLRKKATFAKSKGIVLVFPSLSKLRLGKISTPWGKYNVYVTDKSFRGSNAYRNPIVVSWAAWTLLSEPVLSSTELWWLNAPLYVCYSPVTATQPPVLQSLRTTAAANCMFTQLKVPRKVLQKVKIIDLKMYLPVYQKNGDARHCGMQCRYLQLDPGAFGRPFLSKDLNSLHKFPRSEKAKMWSFNVPGSPSWKRLFFEGALKRSYSSAAAAKDVMRKGFTLGAPLNHSSGHRWKSNIARFIKSASKVLIRQARVNKVDFNLSPIFVWFEKKLSFRAKTHALTLALQRHMTNMRTQYGINTAWLKGRLESILEKYKNKTRSAKQTASHLHRLLKKIERKSLPPSLVKKKNKRTYEKNKAEIRKKTKKLLGALRRSHRTMKRKIQRFQSRMRWMLLRKRNSLRRRGKRGRLCDACYDLLSFENKSIKEKGSFEHTYKKFVVKGQFSPDIRRGKLKISMRNGKRSGGLRILSQNKFVQTFSLAKGMNQFQVRFSTVKRKVAFQFQVKRIKKPICDKDHQKERICRAKCEKKCSCHRLHTMITFQPSSKRWKRFRKSHPKGGMLLFPSNISCGSWCQSGQAKGVDSDGGWFKCSEYLSSCRSAKEYCIRNKPKCLQKCKCTQPCLWRYEWK